MDTYPVFLNKPWMNYSTNAFSGWTLTTTAQTGANIVSALAILVQMAGESLWSIVAFALHQSRATQNPHTGLFRQLQVMLRNPGNSLNTSIEMVKAGWVWHGHIRHPLRKAVLLAMCPLLIFLSFTVAGVLVSNLTIPAYEVNQILLRPSECGLQNWTPNQAEVFLRIQGKFADDIRRGRAYASECYNVVEKKIGCDTLPVQQLPYKTTTNASCPFGNRCTATVRFDTGMLHSHQHLGINAPKGDRVDFQFATTCAVVNIDDLVRNTTDPYGNGIFTIDRVYLGPSLNLNYTYSYSTLQTVQPTTYSLFVYRYYGGTPLLGNDWQPIPEFRQWKGDITVAFVAPNQIMYLAPTFDPVFSAWQNGGTNGVLSAYLPDRHFSTIACVDQMRVCDPDNMAACPPLVGSKMVWPTTLGLNRKQEATAERVLEARLHSTMYDAVAQQGAAALMANDMVVNLASPGLPINQWILEVERWFQALMANVQYRIVDFPNNQWHSERPQLPPPSPPKLWYNGSLAMDQLCHQQLIRSTDQFQSFSLAGIVIVIVVCVAIILTSWFLESCVFCRKSRKSGGTKWHKRIAYAADGKLQLLRLVLQSAGYRGWQKKLEDVPYRPNHDLFFQNDIPPTTEEQNDGENSYQMHNIQDQGQEHHDSNQQYTAAPQEEHVEYRIRRRPLPPSYHSGRYANADDSVPFFQNSTPRYPN